MTDRYHQFYMSMFTASTQFSTHAAYVPPTFRIAAIISANQNSLQLQLASDYTI